MVSEKSPSKIRYSLLEQILIRYGEHIDLYSIALSFLLLVVLYYIRTKIELDLGKDLYLSLASISASILGFLITAISILLALLYTTSHQLADRLKSSPAIEKIYSLYIRAIFTSGFLVIISGFMAVININSLHVLKGGLVSLIVFVSILTIIYLFFGILTLKYTISAFIAYSRLQKQQLKRNQSKSMVDEDELNLPPLVD